MRLSIRYKILAVTGLLLVVAVASYTGLASFIFVEQKTALLYDINHSSAVNTAALLRSSLNQISDQLKLYAVSRILSSESELRLPATALRESHVRSAAFFKRTGESFLPQNLSVDMPPLPLDPATLEPQLKETVASGSAFWRNGVKARSFFLASRLEATIGEKKETFVTVAELDAQPFFDALISANVFDTYLIKGSGEVLAHVHEQKETDTEAIADHPLVASGRKAPELSGVQSYDYQGMRRFGAFAPVGTAGLFFISQADHSEVTSALGVLLRRSLLFGLIVLTLTFIASILFSKSLTRNLQNLTGGAMAIGAGNLNSRIDVRSGDEVETLANSFNQMVEALRASREAIEQYNRELEDKVALRTQQLRETNAAIKDMQEKLLQSTQLSTVGEVAGQTAHELLNPLTAILSRLERSRLSLRPATEGTSDALPAQFSEIVEAWKQDFAKGGLPQLSQALGAPSTAHPGKTLAEEDLENLEKLSHYWREQSNVVAADLDFVRDQAQRIHRIVDRMRELIRASVKSEVACRQAVEEAVATMADFVAKQGVTLKLEWTASDDIAYLNRDELIQILTNLLRNAYQAIGESGRPGAILVVASNAGKTLQVDVTDNGIGIPKDIQKKLFDQGFTTKGPSEGTGLGLAICRRYARAFSGEVELVFSEPTRGTCFRVIIPLKAQEAVA